MRLRLPRRAHMVQTIQLRAELEGSGQLDRIAGWLLGGESLLMHAELVDSDRFRERDIATFGPEVRRRLVASQHQPKFVDSACSASTRCRSASVCSYSGIARPRSPADW